MDGDTHLHITKPSAYTTSQDLAHHYTTYTISLPCSSTMLATNAKTTIVERKKIMTTRAAAYHSRDASEHCKTGSICNKTKNI